MAVLDPEGLFEQAEFLVVPRRPGPPRQVDVRRAISASYYGVFHFVCTEAANMVVGQRWQREARYALVYRSVDHADLARVCSTIQARNADGALAPMGGFGAPLRKFASGATDLKKSRNEADYDPTRLLHTSNAQVAVQLARTTVSAFRQAAAEERSAFLILLLFKRR